MYWEAMGVFWGLIKIHVFCPWQVMLLILVDQSCLSVIFVQVHAFTFGGTLEGTLERLEIL